MVDVYFQRKQLVPLLVQELFALEIRARRKRGDGALTHKVRYAPRDGAFVGFYLIIRLFENCKKA